MIFLKIFNLFISKLLFVLNYSINSSDNLSNILIQHSGKILELNINNLILRFFINKEGIFEISEFNHKSPNMVITLNESIMKIAQNINDSDIYRFMHISGDLQFMNDISILLKNIEKIFKDKSNNIVNKFINNLILINENINDFSSNFSNIFNIFFCKKLDILADRSIYQDFENNLQSIYIDIKKIHIRINNLYKIINCSIEIDS